MRVHANEDRGGAFPRHPAHALLLAAWRLLRAYRLDGKLAAFVIFAGQSNALGFGMDGSTLPADLAKADPMTLIWSERAQGFEVMQPGVNTGTGANPAAWGPEAAFARAFRKANPSEPLYIVKSARGSTGLAADPGRPDWSPASSGELFDATQAQAAGARAAAGGPPVDAVFIVQGEQDASDPAAAQAYGRNVTDWFAAIRGRWMADPQGRIFYARVGEPLAYGGTVLLAQAQADAADPFARSLATSGFEMQADRLHFAAAGHVRMGEAFDRLFEAERAAAKDPPGTFRLVRRALRVAPGGR